MPVSVHSNLFFFLSANGFGLSMCSAVRKVINTAFERKRNDRDFKLSICTLIVVTAIGEGEMRDVQLVAVCKCVGRYA